ncbi:MAG: hypothetical protein EBX36_06575 [Planctomycetia bacterium]|nr:hypothetical protein [Planctomycetia bacterium]
MSGFVSGLASGLASGFISGESPIGGADAGGPPTEGFMAASAAAAMAAGSGSACMRGRAAGLSPGFSMEATAGGASGMAAIASSALSGTGGDGGAGRGRSRLRSGGGLDETAASDEGMASRRLAFAVGRRSATAAASSAARRVRLRLLTFREPLLPIRDVQVRQPPGHAGKGQNRQHDPGDGDALAVDRRADADLLGRGWLSTRSVGRRARHRRRHGRRRGHDDGGHRRHPRETLRYRRHRGLTPGRRGGHRESRGGGRPRRHRGDLGEDVVPRLLDTPDEAGPRQFERPRGDRPEQIEAGVRGPGHDARIHLAGRHAEHGTGIAQTQGVDAQPLPAGIERSVLHHGCCRLTRGSRRGGTSARPGPKTAWPTW